jgi:hypothetical protein
MDDPMYVTKVIFAIANQVDILSCIVYCFQSVRFIIDENFGCFYGTRSSKVINGILFGPTLVLAVATLIYGGARPCNSSLFTLTPFMHQSLLFTT